MKIISLTLRNRLEEWEVKKIEFSLITLLVGASGVGKTQILEALQIIRKIASGKNFPGISWELYFQMRKAIELEW
ncbi:MAG: hypothetical protein IPG53_17545 [Ignavibacteriales bacterium]|nr:hypothetical protein [Ignavibacteriales bacterium]